MTGESVGGGVAEDFSETVSRDVAGTERKSYRVPVLAADVIEVASSNVLPPSMLRFKIDGGRRSRKGSGHRA